MVKRFMLAMLVVAAVSVEVSQSHAYAVATPTSLADRAANADLICKATVIADVIVTDLQLPAQAGVEVHETTLRIISIFKGPAKAKVIRFRHYAALTKPSQSISEGYTPANVTMLKGQSYLVLAKRVKGTLYRSDSKDEYIAPAGAMLTANREALLGTTIGEVVLNELKYRIVGKNPVDATDAIEMLNTISGGAGSASHDIPRAAAIDALRPTVLSPNQDLAMRAIAAIANDNPYFSDQAAPYWLAGIGKGRIEGVRALMLRPHADADAAKLELRTVLDGPASGTVRSSALLALARSNVLSADQLATWSRDSDAQLRRAAVLASVELRDRAIIKRAITDATPDVRRAAALAIGFSQDPALLSSLDTLLKDPSVQVRAGAALSLLSFDPATARAVMMANLGSDYKPLFVNLLAQQDPKPYVAQLAEVIEKHLTPPGWWGGATPAGVSWSILFAYVCKQSAADVTAGKFDSSLAALERMPWFSSSEPRNLYAFYVVRGLPKRAAQFRTTMTKDTAMNMKYFFDMADKSPETYVPTP